MAVGLARLAFSDCDGNGICDLHEREHRQEHRHEHQYEHWDEHEHVQERWCWGNYFVEADRWLYRYPLSLRVSSVSGLGAAIPGLPGLPGGAKRYAGCLGTACSIGNCPAGLPSRGSSFLRA